MWIRSQSKKELVNITGISIGENNLIRGYEQSCTDGEFWDLGEYSTEEKAIKVLDMIQERICGIEGMRLKVIMLNGDNRHTFITEGYVFQMPQENEV